MSTRANDPYLKTRTFCIISRVPSKYPDVMLPRLFTKKLRSISNSDMLKDNLKKVKNSTDLQHFEIDSWNNIYRLDLPDKMRQLLDIVNSTDGPVRRFQDLRVHLVQWYLQKVGNLRPYLFEKMRKKGSKFKMTIKPKSPTNCEYDKVPNSFRAYFSLPILIGTREFCNLISINPSVLL